jgi:hypothetical protein
VKPPDFLNALDTDKPKTTRQSTDGVFYSLQYRQNKRIGQEGKRKKKTIKCSTGLSDGI